MIKINNQKLTEADVKKIDQEVISHECDPKYMVSDEQNPEWKLLRCVMCGIRVTQRKRICKSCRHPYSGVYKLPDYCHTCSKNKRLGEFNKEAPLQERKILTQRKGGPFYEI